MLGGKLVHQTSDEYGSIEVVDYMQEIRALHFGNKTQQSACLLCAPHFLVHKYAQAMTLPLCWIKPKRALILGLGAGSIANFLYHNYPELIIDAVELRPLVSEVAMNFFFLPTPNKRLNIFHESASEWLKKTHSDHYDLIIVDTFLTSDSGKDITVDLSDSFNAIYKLLSGNGTATFNNLNSDLESYPGYNNLLNLFSNNTYSIDIEKNNSIIIASKKPIDTNIEKNKLLTSAINKNINYFDYYKTIKPISAL